MMKWSCIMMCYDEMINEMCWWNGNGNVKLSLQQVLRHSILFWPPSRTHTLRKLETPNPKDHLHHHHPLEASPRPPHLQVFPCKLRFHRRWMELCDALPHIWLSFEAQIGVSVNVCMVCVCFARSCPGQEIMLDSNPNLQLSIPVRVFWIGTRSVRFQRGILWLRVWKFELSFACVRTSVITQCRVGSSDCRTILAAGMCLHLRNVRSTSLWTCSS